VRVAHVIGTLAPVGGAQTYARAAAEQLAKAGHEVAVLHQDGEAPAIEGVSLYPFGMDSEALSSLERFDPDVVHAHDWALWDALVETQIGRPVVRSLHNFAFACASGSKYFRDGAVCVRPHGPGCFPAALVRGCPHRLDPRAFVAGYRRVDRVLPRLRRTRGIILHSHYMRELALANGLPRAHLEVVEHCVARPAVPTPTAPNQARTIAFIGRLVPEKGLDVLLKALASEPEAWDRLLVAGDGWARQKYERLTKRLRLEGSVEFLGHRSVDEAAETMAQAHVVAVPSRWPEPFGIVGLEAMAQTRPVVASNVGGMPEWLDDGETGILVPPGDVAALARAVAWILQDSPIAERMGLEAWRRVERFSPEGHLDALLAVYERAAASDTREPLRRASSSW
jgi:glycosyltransferase involved in cell wall biosynthesis